HPGERPRRPSAPSQKRRNSIDSPPPGQRGPRCRKPHALQWLGCPPPPARGDAVGRQWATIQALSPAMQVAERAAASLSFEDVARLAGPEMAAVDDLIRESLKSDVMLVSQVSEYIVTSGGKRLRPLIVLLAARALGYGGRQHPLAAAIIEFIPPATLLHDDVVDSSARRRGRDTANTVFGNQASVLVGDFLYSRAFQMMVDLGRMRVLQILADATNTIAAGEVMQLMNVHDPDLSEAS